MAARNGILVKDRLALEEMRQVDVVLFDKTGTLTLGRHTVRGIIPLDGNEDRLLAVAAAVESDSEHPLARAIVAEAAKRGSVAEATAFRAMSGRGVEAWSTAWYRGGGPALLRERGIG